ncbi:MAG: hypothetical protein LBR62_01445, partial [Puniceicoccales bacterium]|nr:hypothetical protein [Puniceicoccales bacterium]
MAIDAISSHQDKTQEGDGILVFKSGVVIGSSIMTTLNTLQTSLLDHLREDLRGSNPSVNLLFSLLLATCERWHETKSERDGRTYQIVMRTTDSEIRALHVLQTRCVIEGIVSEGLGPYALRLYDKDRKNQIHFINSIEFHGCTTRDMCPFCFAHMNMVQVLSNLHDEN